MEEIGSHNFERKLSKIYSLSAIFIIISIAQWGLLVNFDIFQFFINSWLIMGAYITFTLIIVIFSVTDFMDKKLPAAVEWIFCIVLVEIMVIALSPVVDRVDDIILYISLIIILICMIGLILLGGEINVDHLPIFVLVIFSANILLIVLIVLLILIAKFLSNFYTIAFFIVSAFVYPILIMNTLYVSLLIYHDRYEIKKLTDCLKPALYIYGIFGTFVWFSLFMDIEIHEMLTEKRKNC